MMTSVLMKKAMTGAIAAITVAGVLAVTSTDAEAQRRRGISGGAVAAGVVGGLALGALAAGAARPAYGAPAYGYGYGPGPVYYDRGPACYETSRRVWDGYGWRRNRVTVCD